MVGQVLDSLFRKPATTRYPFVKTKSPFHIRGKIKFVPELCIGCKLCEKDCPSDAIHIVKLGEKQWSAEFDLGRCIYCGQCVDSCLKKALLLTDEFELASLERGTLKVVFSAPKKEETKPAETITQPAEQPKTDTETTDDQGCEG